MPPRKSEKLTVKQEKFCQAYIETGNASEAAQACGIEWSDVPPPSNPYVYFLLCPDKQKILYVGKGTRRRMFNHMRDARNGRVSGLKKHKVLCALLEIGCEPCPVVIATCHDDRAALRLERSFIFRIGVERLANDMSGQRHMDDIILAEIEHSLSRVMPFDQWVAVRHRSHTEVSLYHRIVAELEKMRDDPFARAREFSLENGRVTRNRVVVDQATLQAALISKLDLVGNGASR